MATITNTIGSAGGRDYSTPAAWAAALPANLVTAGNSYVGQCFNDSEFTSATALLTLSGHTTDATHTITITAGSGQSFRDNANVQSNALKYNASNGVGIRCTGAYTSTIVISDANVTISNLQISNSGGGNNNNAIRPAGASLVIDDCIMVITAGSGNACPMVSTGSGSTKARNSLFIQGHGGNGLIVNMAFNVFSAYFCTFVCPGDLTKATNGVVSAYVAVVLENCAIFGATTCAAVSGGGSSLTVTTCMTDQASPPTGFSTVTYTSQFVDTTNAAQDFREKVGANLQGAGTSDATNGATDIAGTARPQGSNWDIGCWELVSAGGIASWGYEAEPTFAPRRRSVLLSQLAQIQPEWPFTAVSPPAQFGWNNPEQFAERLHFQPLQPDQPPEVWPITVALTPSQYGWHVEATFPDRRKWQAHLSDADIAVVAPAATPTQQGFDWAAQFPERRKFRLFQPDLPAEQWPITIVVTPSPIGWDEPTYRVVRRKPQPWQPDDSYDQWMSTPPPTGVLRMIYGSIIRVGGLMRRN